MFEIPSFCAAGANFRNVMVSKIYYFAKFYIYCDYMTLFITKCTTPAIFAFAHFTLDEIM